jgi:hypothetical protein
MIIAKKKKKIKIFLRINNPYTWVSTINVALGEGGRWGGVAGGGGIFLSNVLVEKYTIHPMYKSTRLSNILSDHNFSHI